MTDGNRLAKAQARPPAGAVEEALSRPRRRAVAVHGNTLNYLTENADSIQLLVVGHERARRNQRSRRPARLRVAARSGLFSIDLRTAERIVSTRLGRVYGEGFRW